MLTYGLTGGIGSGKSVVGRMFDALGVPVFDADQLGRELLAPGADLTRQVLEKMPSCAEGSSIHRKKLAALVFADPSLRAWLEDLMHPAICSHYQQKISLLPNPRPAFALLEGAVFLESRSHAQFPLSGLVVVTSPLSVRIQRLQKRDGLDLGQLKARITAQMPQEKKILFASYLIDNGGTQEQTLSKVEMVATLIARECGGPRS